MKLHRESKGTLLVVSLLVLVLGGLSLFLLKIWSLIIIVPLLVLLGLTLWFFRVPNRKIAEYQNEIIAPVDGKVVMIKEVHENEFIKEKCIQISVFMSPLNVHICRYPVTGEVVYKKYHKGKYLVAWHEKSSTENERTSVAVKANNGAVVLFRQIAGYVARRIVFYCNEGDKAKAGHEFGFIKFGSRMDVFVPLDTEILCKIGDITKGGLDVIAKLK